MAFDHGHRGPHILLEPVNVGAVLKPQGRIGMAEAIDAALVAVCVAFEPRRLDQGREAGPVGYGFSVLVTEHVVIGLGVVGSFTQAVEVPLGTRLADHQPLACLALDPQRGPDAMLIGVAVDVPPFERSGFTLPHAAISHDQDVVSQEFSVLLDLGVAGFLGPASHELIKPPVFLGREGRPLVDLDLVVFEVG